MHWTIKKYIKYLRRQHIHIQEMHAFVFAISITAVISFFVLYTQYGFWHPRYDRLQDNFTDTNNTNTDTNTIANQEQKPEAPGEMLSRFFGEAKTKFSNLGTAGAQMLNATETYQK